MHPHPTIHQSVHNRRSPLIVSTFLQSSQFTREQRKFQPVHLIASGRRSSLSTRPLHLDPIFHRRVRRRHRDGRRGVARAEIFIRENNAIESTERSRYVSRDLTPRISRPRRDVIRVQGAEGRGSVGGFLVQEKR